MALSGPGWRTDTRNPQLRRLSLCRGTSDSASMPMRSCTLLPWGSRLFGLFGGSAAARLFHRSPCRRDGPPRLLRLIGAGRWAWAPGAVAGAVAYAHSYIVGEVQTVSAFVTSARGKWASANGSSATTPCAAPLRRSTDSSQCRKFKAWDEKAPACRCAAFLGSTAARLSTGCAGCHSALHKTSSAGGIGIASEMGLQATGWGRYLNGRADMSKWTRFL
jgi:hypothetical protein